MRHKTLRFLQDALALAALLKKRAEHSEDGLHFPVARFTDTDPAEWTNATADGPPAHRYIVRWQYADTDALEALKKAGKKPKSRRQIGNSRTMATREEALAFHRHVWRFERWRPDFLLLKAIYYRVS